MKPTRLMIAAAAAAGALCVNRTAMACAACYSQSDSAMAKGMNAGILALLGVIAVVLGGAATFFVFIARRSAVAAKSKETGK